MIKQFDNFTIIYREPLQIGIVSISDGWDIIRFYKIEDVEKLIEVFEEIKEDMKKGKSDAE